MEAGTRRAAIRWRQAALGLVFLVGLALGSAGAAAAQVPAGQGPQFPTIGPSAPPTEAAGPASASATPPAGRSARCRWDLAGVWEGRGQQTEPAGGTYTTRLVIRQHGNYIVAEQASDGISYYGVCSGDRVELDAYSGGAYIGVQTGTVSGNGRRIESTWVLYRPDYAAGYETLTASGRAQR